ncbi:SprT-like domain-containing protein [Paenibacillus sp. NPDC057967]|uniref:SprT-like domain-containing protein n=1 Tax=Paenibacillus sp. NPDC057967 TaxID=3346293 RepID=UPI0036DB4C48
MGNEKPRYIASPYSYYGDSSRPRTYSVWDTKGGEWTGDFVGNKEGAQEVADNLNYKYYECTECGYVQVEEATLTEFKCDHCSRRVIISYEAVLAETPAATPALPNIKTATDELHRCFRAFNDHYFNGEVAEPAITIQAAGKRQAYGWCSLVPFWHRPGAEGDGSEPDGHRYEINLSAEHMARDHYDILRTLLHEMVHLHNVHIGVQDVSRGGTYHNLRFKAACERDNMFYYDFDKPDKKIGWSAAKLTDETRAFIDTIGVSSEAFGLYRAVPEKAKKTSNSFKLECPDCGAKVRASKPGLLIRCKPCDVDMEEI